MQTYRRNEFGMIYKDNIISIFADKECEKVCGKTIRELQCMTEGMQSGDDSGLENIWDEVCVQVQFDQSMFWDLYLEVLDNIIMAEVKNLEEHILRAIWLQTDSANDWKIDMEILQESKINDKLDHSYNGLVEADPDCNLDDQPPYEINEIIYYIRHEYVLAKAGSWSNIRIRRYADI